MKLAGHLVRVCGESFALIPYLFYVTGDRLLFSVSGVFLRIEVVQFESDGFESLASFAGFA